MKVRCFQSSRIMREKVVQIFFPHSISVLGLVEDFHLVSPFFIQKDYL